MKERNETICECVASLSHKDLHDLKYALWPLKISSFETDAQALIIKRLLDAVEFQIGLEQGCEE